MVGLNRFSVTQLVRHQDAVYRQPAWSYDTTLARYRDQRSGRFLAQSEALALTQRSIAQAQAELDSLTDQLDQRVLTLAQWQRQMAALIKQVHLAQFILGRGGLAHTTPADFLALARVLKNEYRYLDGFGRDLSAGQLSLAQSKARARLYLAKSRMSYWAGQQQAQKQGPMPSEMRRLLAPVDHCLECLRYAKAGWVPIGHLPLPTVDCSCQSNCRCRVEYR